ncbi:MAG: hypothetical protein IAG13_31380, partial [Deltaproteobacteria bacterium]|nr:hypothetical protein [Nannocystaceae bacterium]
MRSGRRATAWRFVRVLFVGVGLAAIGLWLSSYIGAPDPTEPVISRLAREGFAPGFGVASAAIMVLVWTSSPRRVTDVRVLDQAAAIADGRLATRSSTARTADAARPVAARGPS